MQTFLPYADFTKSAKVLDDKRLGKQRVETLQLIGGITRRLLVSTTKVDTGRTRDTYWDGGSEVFPDEFTDLDRLTVVEEPIFKTVPLPRDQWHITPRVTANGRTWGDHVVGQMWTGHEFALLEYQRAICAEWTSRGFKDTCFDKSECILHHHFEAMFDRNRRRAMPAWLGSYELHRSHRSNLVRKMPEHYGPLFPGTPDDLPYVWPGQHD